MPKKKLLPYPPDFETAWKVYPWGKSKYDAFLAWRDATDDGVPRETILAGIVRFRACREVLDLLAKGEGRFIPHMGRWIRSRRWEDEPEPGTKAPEPIGETMSRKRAEAAWVTLMMFGAQGRDEDMIVNALSGVPKGSIVFECVFGWRDSARVKLTWEWPKDVGVSFLQNDDWTDDRVLSMGRVNAELESLLKGWTE